MTSPIAFAQRPQPPGPAPLPVRLLSTGALDVVFLDGERRDARARRSACVALHEAGWVVVPPPPPACESVEAARRFAEGEPHLVGHMLDHASRVEEIFLVFEVREDTGSDTATSREASGRAWLRQRARHRAEAEQHAGRVTHWSSALAESLGGHCGDATPIGRALAVPITLPRGRVLSPRGRRAMTSAPPLPDGNTAVTAIGPFPASAWPSAANRRHE